MARITNPRQRSFQGTDYKFAPETFSGHGLQIRTRDLFRARITNPRQRPFQGMESNPRQ
jgi:hypothetical protein